MQGLHKGWIFCRDNAEQCAEFVSPTGTDPATKMHQRFQMHEVPAVMPHVHADGRRACQNSGEKSHPHVVPPSQVNKLIWPAPNGIGIHQLEGILSSQATSLRFGIINRTVIGRLTSPCQLPTLIVRVQGIPPAQMPAWLHISMPPPGFLTVLFSLPLHIQFITGAY